MTFEVEQKFRVRDLAGLERRLKELAAVAAGVQEHSDSYFNHPCRDFAETKEALRIRRVDGTPLITYKGPKFPGKVKARLEREWRLDPGDADGTSTEDLLRLLGFQPVAVVRKTRRLFRLPGEWSELAVTIDDVDGLGCFSEVELVADQLDDVERGRERVISLSDVLQLGESEPRSYLTMLLALPAG